MFYQAKDIYRPLLMPGVLPLDMHTHRLLSHSLQLWYQWGHHNQIEVHSNEATFWKYQPKRKDHQRMYLPRQRKLLQSPCLPDVHSKSIIHSPTFKCLISGRHWGPRDGSWEEQKQTDHDHGAMVHKRKCEELFLRHFDVQRCSISFSRK